jgi:hypothetical protein
MLLFSTLEMNQKNVLAVYQQVNKEELNYYCRVNLSGFIIQISIVYSVPAISFFLYRLGQ